MDAADDDCPCESQVPPEHSPGPIHPAEQLARLVPKKFITENGVDPGYFSTVHARGLSTGRVRHLRQPEIDETLRELFPNVEKDRRQELCSDQVSASVSVLRQKAHAMFPDLKVKIEDRRVFCVADTPIPPLKPAHADVTAAPGLFTGDTIGPPLSKKKLERTLKSIFGTPEPIPPYPEADAT